VIPLLLTDALSKATTNERPGHAGEASGHAMRLPTGIPPRVNPVSLTSCPYFRAFPGISFSFARSGIFSLKPLLGVAVLNLWFYPSTQKAVYIYAVFLAFSAKTCEINFLNRPI
jgi:hypothetical protein